MTAGQVRVESTVRLEQLQTPALILDEGILRTNIARMADHAGSMGVGLRPHFKTPKSARIAELLTSRNACGLTVSTLNEAEYLASEGYDDLFYAVALAPSKVERVAKIQKQGVALRLLVDSLEAAEAIAAAAVRQGVVLPLMIEIDIDHYRSGVPMASPEFDALARSIHAASGTELAGVMSYAGASYHATSTDQVAALAETHRGGLIETRRRLERDGLPCPTLSFGATPAVVHAASLTGLDELRCGIYAFQDLFQVGVGVCDVDDIALSVLTTVISRQPQLNRFVVDAGGLALSKDRGTAGQAIDRGYGLVCDLAGRPIDDLFVETVSQELGLVTSRTGTPIEFDRIAIDDRLRIRPNHADMTAAAYEVYQVVNRSTVVSETWSRRNGW